jgi:FixJ family two-component response regulator
VKRIQSPDSDECEEATIEAPLVSVVDDDDLMRRSTSRLLRCSALRVEVFASAEDFLQSGRITETACLLLDVRMPGMNGLELQRHLMENGRRTPIIFLSAQASEEEERRALQAGAVGFLRKPVSKETLLHAIRVAIDGPNNKS